MFNQIISQILIYLTDFSSFVQKLTGGVKFSGLHYDWLIILFFIFAIFIVALSFGRSRMLLALLSLYVAAFIESHFIYFDKLRDVIKNKPDYWLHLGLFLLFYVIVFGIFSQSFLKHRLTLAESSIAPLILIAIVEIGFLTAIILSYFPNELLNKLSPKLLPYFATKNAQFWWAIVSILTLILGKKRKEI